jgi:hypothetical protein
VSRWPESEWRESMDSKRVCLSSGLRLFGFTNRKTHSWWFKNKNKDP